MGEYSAFMSLVILFFSIEYYLNRLHNIYVYMYVYIESINIYVYCVISKIVGIIYLFS